MNPGDNLRSAIFAAQSEARGEKPRPAPANEAFATPQTALQRSQALRPPDRPKPRSNGRVRSKAKKALPPQKRRGQIIMCADGSNRTIAKCWQEIFAYNEEIRFTDEEIRVWMNELFPSHTISKNLQCVGRIRGQYNRGQLAGMNGVPQKLSRRYVWAGGVLWIATARGKAIGRIIDYGNGTSSVLPLRKQTSLDHNIVSGYEGPTLRRMLSSYDEEIIGRIIAARERAQRDRIETESGSASAS